MTPGLDRTLLQQLKRLEAEEDALPLAGDLPAMRLVLVWRRITIYNRAPDDYRDLLNRSLAPWRRLWLPFELDYAELAAAADIPTERLAREEAERAMSLLWVYPDNTTHAHAHNLAAETYKARIAQNTRAGSMANLARKIGLIEARLGLGKEAP
ncbi:MAG: hypothetical protein IPK72_21175 [Candidatus Eisenbacteria bacterium]|nr:hypothetical protein [Candidatus Eisenbacteria bacterium]